MASLLFSAFLHFMFLLLFGSTEVVNHVLVLVVLGDDERWLGVVVATVLVCLPGPVASVLPLLHLLRLLPDDQTQRLLLLVPGVPLRVTRDLLVDLVVLRTPIGRTFVAALGKS